jgi:hypothetical protein
MSIIGVERRIVEFPQTVSKRADSVADVDNRWTLDIEAGWRSRTFPDEVYAWQRQLRQAVSASPRYPFKCFASSRQLYTSSISSGSPRSSTVSL